MSTIAQMIDQYEVFLTARGYGGIAPRGKVIAGYNPCHNRRSACPILYHRPSAEPQQKGHMSEGACVLEGNSGPSRSSCTCAVAVAEACAEFNDPGRINEIFEDMTIV